MDAGHRILSHTADVMIEAWAPTRMGCFEQAARGLIEAFVALRDVPATEPIAVGIDANTDDEMLAALLDEIVFLAEVSGAIPVHLTLEESEDGGLAGVFDVVPIGELEVVGPAPKSISYAGDVVRADDAWRCRVVADI